MAPQYSYAIGLSGLAVVNLESLSTYVSPPKSVFKSYSEVRDLSSGSNRGLGLPQATWVWSVIPDDQRDMLRTFCPGASASVFITTRTNDSNDSYATYAASMVWPSLDEERDTGRRMNFKIEFKALVPYP